MYCIKIYFFEGIAQKIGAMIAKIRRVLSQFRGNDNKEEGSKLENKLVIIVSGN